MFSNFFSNIVLFFR